MIVSCLENGFMEYMQGINKYTQNASTTLTIKIKWVIRQSYESQLDFCNMKSLGYQNSRHN